MVQTGGPIQPVAYVVETNGDIGIGHAVLLSGGWYRSYTKTKQGVLPSHANWFAFEWETPAFTGDAPIIVTLSSKKPISLAGVYRVPYEWPKQRPFLSHRTWPFVSGQGVQLHPVMFHPRRLVVQGQIPHSLISDCRIT